MVTDARCSVSTHARTVHDPHRWWTSDDTAHDKGHQCDGQIEKDMTETSIQTGPPKPEASLYDIGAFLAGGLNMTPEQARAMVDSLSERMAASTLERDQEDVAEIEFDILADLVDMVKRFLDIWDDDTHVLVIATPFSGWSIEHSLRCRAGGAMASCPYHRYIAKADQSGGLPVGRRIMTLSPDGNAMAFKAAP